MGSNRRTASRVIGLVMAAALFAVGCGDTDSGDTEIALPGPELVARGEGIYQEDCAECHGSDLRGTAQGPSHLSILYEPSHHGDHLFALAVREGSPQDHWAFGDMPPVEGLTDNDIRAIVAYVRETQGREGFEPYPP